MFSNLTIHYKSTLQFFIRGQHVQDIRDVDRWRVVAGGDGAGVVDDHAAAAAEKEEEERKHLTGEKCAKKWFVPPRTVFFPSVALRTST